MASPVPKPKEERRNFTKPHRGEWVDLDPLAKPVLPARPPDYLAPDDGWSKATLMTWKAWRADPVTSQWSPSDIEYAHRTIAAIETRPSALAEHRLRMGELGLTPKGKRDLRWRNPGQKIHPDDNPPKSTERRKARQRAHLTAVK